MVLALLVTPCIVAPAPFTPAGSDLLLQVSPNQKHVEKLTAALDNMTKNYASLVKFSKSKGIDGPGPQDILDYKIGDLWKKGIDGSGTTVAVIEGWDYPGIKDYVKTFDQKYGLPDPDIQTIYPSGDGHLPAQCPPGMVALGSYG
ncbi:MAG: hypothetical protein ACREP9_04435, partial [Candidatus Dormibacteraceae bacterium]